MDLRLTFNEVPELYDQYRPTYLPELYADIFKYSGIGHTSSALEIGIGTGLATLPFLNLKAHVTAVEIGDKLAAYSRKKFAQYDNFEVVNSAFEDFEHPDNSFDMAYSATAFHWVPEELGHTKVYRLLKSGGTFARFANHPYKDKENEPLHLAFQELYDKYMPHISLKRPVEYSEDDAKEKAEIIKKYGFMDVKYKLYHRTRTFDADAYAALISAYSDHRVVGAERLQQFTTKIKETVNQYGGKITMYDTLDLQLARKP